MFVRAPGVRRVALLAVCMAVGMCVYAQPTRGHLTPAAEPQMEGACDSLESGETAFPTAADHPTDDTLAKGVEAAFDAMTKLLAEQAETVAALNVAIQAQARQLSALKKIASNGFDAYQRSAVGVGASGGGMGGGLGGQGGMGMGTAAAGMGMGAGAGVGEGLVSSSFNELNPNMLVKYRVSWFDNMQLLSAVRTDAAITAVTGMPQDGGQGLMRYAAVGDATGKVYVFRPQGELILEFETGGDSPVTALAAYSVRRNETRIVAGHDDGTVTVHKLVEAVDHNALDNSMYTLSVSTLHTLEMERTGSREGGARGAADALAEVEAQLGPVVVVESYRMAQKRYIVAVNSMGDLTAFKENGTVHGTARTVGPVIALRPSANSPVFVTAAGVGWLDLRTMVASDHTCAGLNGSHFVAAAFDALVASRLHALTADGELLTLVLSGERKTDCVVKSRRSAGVMAPVSLVSIKGYLVAQTAEALWVFNTTGIARGGPRLVLQEALSAVAAQFGGTCETFHPLLAANRQRQILVSFCDGVLATFESHLPLHKPPDWNPKLWSQPLFLGAMICVGMYQFYNVRHRGGGGMGRGRGGGMGGMDMPAGMMEKLKEAGVSPASIADAMKSGGSRGGGFSGRAGGY